MGTNDAPNLRLNNHMRSLLRRKIECAVARFLLDLIIASTADHPEIMDTLEDDPGESNPAISESLDVEIEFWVDEGWWAGFGRRRALAIVKLAENYDWIEIGNNRYGSKPCRLTPKGVNALCVLT